MSSSPKTTGPVESAAAVTAAAVAERRRSRQNDGRQQRRSNKKKKTKSIHPVEPCIFDGVHWAEEEVDVTIEKFSNNDSNNTKTWSRLVVEKFLAKFEWYFPGKKNVKGPSLSKAYAFYEHITLPRHFVVGDLGEEQVAKSSTLRNAEPGHPGNTRLYHPFLTGPNAFVNWGPAMDSYFISIRLLVLVLFLAGLINIPLIHFYRSADYNIATARKIESFLLRGSSVCTAWEWVVCMNCTAEQYPEWDGFGDRFGAVEVGPGDDPEKNGTVLVQRNACVSNRLFLEGGTINLATLIFLIVAMALLCLYLDAREVRLDEDEVTAKDYTVVVRNPPADAWNPDEWRTFFQELVGNNCDRQRNAAVTLVTIVLNNNVLVRKLVERRVQKNELRRLLPKGTDLDDQEQVQCAVEAWKRQQTLEQSRQGYLTKVSRYLFLPMLQSLGLFLGPEAYVTNMLRLTDEIKLLQHQEYEVEAVFVTFETEEGQRAALEALSVGKIDIIRNNKSKLANPHAVFRGHTVLLAEEPADPSSIRWLDLTDQTSGRRRRWLRMATALSTVLVLCLAGVLVGIVRLEWGTFYAGILINILNSIIPEILLLLMQLEFHHNEGSYQASLYLKTTLFRWGNTAILPWCITPFMNTVSGGRSEYCPIVQIKDILISAIFVNPLIQVLDLYSNFKKHFLAPRAINQEQMNRNFLGTYYSLGERFTSLTVVLFVCFFYSVHFPTGFFFGAAILCVQYHTDKYCLLRIWSRIPSIDTYPAKFSRRYFFSGAVVAFALISAYFWAQFPYDNLCHAVDKPISGVAGLYHDVLFLNGTRANVTVSQDTAMFHCDQHWRHFDKFFFPPTSDVQPAGLRWMNEAQSELTDLYGLTVVAVLVGYVAIVFGGSIIISLLSWFRGVYKPFGETQKIDFSSTSIDAYVPQIKVDGFPFPFLACSIDKTIDQNLIGWNDPKRPHDFYNLIFDVPYVEAERSGIDRPHEEPEKESSETSRLIPTAYGNVEFMAKEKQVYRTKPVFSIVEHYPPLWHVHLAEEELSGGEEVIKSGSLPRLLNRPESNTYGAIPDPPSNSL